MKNRQRSRRRLAALPLRPPDQRLDDAIRDAQWGGTSRGGVAQHVAGDAADARYRSEHRVGLVVDGFLVEVDDATGIRQIVRHEHDPAYCQRCVVARLRLLRSWSSSPSPSTRLARVRSRPGYQDGIPYDAGQLRRIFGMLILQPSLVF